MDLTHLRDQAEQEFKGLWDLYQYKGRTYGTPEDPHANVRTAEEYGVPAYVSALVEARGALKRLSGYKRTGTIATDKRGVRNALRDTAVWAVIALVEWEELYGKEATEEPDAVGRPHDDYYTGLA